MAFFYNGTEIENIGINDMFSELQVVQRIYCEISKGNKKLVYEKKPPILVAGTSTGLWYSENMGVNWTQSNIASGHFGNRNNKSDEVGYGNIVYSPLYKKFFAHADSGNKDYLYVSDDGKTWTTLLPYKYWTDLQVSGNGYVYCSGANTSVRTGLVFYYDENNNVMQDIGIGLDYYYYILKDKISNICYLYDSKGLSVHKFLNSNYEFICNKMPYTMFDTIGCYLADGILIVRDVDYDDSDDSTNYTIRSYNIIEKKELPSLPFGEHACYGFYENGLHIVTSQQKTWYAQMPINDLSTASYVNNYFDDITSYKTDDGIAHFLLKKGSYIYNTTSLDGVWTQELAEPGTKLPTEVKIWDYRWKKYLFYPSNNKIFIKDIFYNGAIQTIVTNFGECYQIVANQ